MPTIFICVALTAPSNLSDQTAYDQVDASHLLVIQLFPIFAIPVVKWWRSPYARRSLKHKSLINLIPSVKPTRREKLTKTIDPLFHSAHRWEFTIESNWSLVPNCNWRLLKLRARGKASLHLLISHFHLIGQNDKKWVKLQRMLAGNSFRKYSEIISLTIDIIRSLIVAHEFVQFHHHHQVSTSANPWHTD